VGLTPCNEDTLQSILETWPHLDLVVHVRRNRPGAFARLVEIIPLARQRMIPQAYSPKEYKALRDLGFERIIWTIYRYSNREDREQLLRDAQELSPYALTMPFESLDRDLLDRLLAVGVPVYVHTVNDCETAAEIRGWGAQIYSDDLTDASCSGTGSTAAMRRPRE
jgi:hypothetical protein